MQSEDEEDVFEVRGGRGPGSRRTAKSAAAEGKKAAHDEVGGSNRHAVERGDGVGGSRRKGVDSGSKGAGRVHGTTQGMNKTGEGGAGRKTKGADTQHAVSTAVLSVPEMMHQLTELRTWKENMLRMMEAEGRVVDFGERELVGTGGQGGL